ncbi:MAG: DUF4249 domain-containing protein [Tunicatimonas sp.]|uniref:DUF4249 domain-containing protein n=1 Tax=Tunicatimonas sp. TaxID=1940096 RepID=UPI003C72B536
MKNILLTILSVILLAACTQEADVVLPAYESQLVVECYLEAGSPPRLILSESTSFFDASTAFSLVSDATVLLSYSGKTDTLVNGIFSDPNTGQVYNYGSTRPLPDQPQGDFTLVATDSKGRKIEATTQFMPVVPIASLEPTFNEENEAFCLTTFADHPAQTNYYLLVLNEGQAYAPSVLSTTLDDNFANENNNIVFGSGYDFVEGDTIVGTVYHLEPMHYRFLSSASSAEAANFNPFAVSGEITTNVRGGLGIVAALSYDRQTVIVPTPPR